MPYLGVYDPDPKRSVYDKFTDACNRYRRKFGKEPTGCLANPEDAAELRRGGGTHGVVVAAESYIPRHTFYIGQDGERFEYDHPDHGTTGDDGR